MQCHFSTISLSLSPPLLWFPKGTERKYLEQWLPVHQSLFCAVKLGNLGEAKLQSSYSVLGYIFKKMVNHQFTVRSLKISSAELMSNSPFPPKVDFDDILWISNFQDRGRNQVVWLFKWNLFFLSLSVWRKFYGETNRMKASEQFFLRYCFSELFKLFKRSTSLRYSCSVWF